MPVLAVEQFVRQNGISENTLLPGAFAYALGKYTGENRSLLCTVNNGRHAAEPANSVGMFVRTLLQGGSRRLESPAHQPAGDQ